MSAWSQQLLNVESSDCLINGSLPHIQLRHTDREMLNCNINFYSKESHEFLGAVMFDSGEFEDKGTLVRSIINGKSRVGKIQLKYIVFDSFKHPELESITYDFKNKNIGHRGYGATNKNIIKNDVVIENTINSFLTAERHGVDYIEFDVQLTADNVPVICHDLYLQIKTTDSSSQPQVVKVPVNTLTYPQLQKLQPVVIDKTYYLQIAKEKKKEPTNFFNCERTVSDSDFRVSEKKIEFIEDALLQQTELADTIASCGSPKDFIHQSRCVKQDKKNKSLFQSTFPSLEHVFTLVPEHIGFDIEIKYPTTTEETKKLGFMERNEYLNRILEVVFQFVGKRKIFFSCFDPDVITLLSIKQHAFPVFLLTTGHVNPELTDSRRDSLKSAIEFAQRMNIHGIVTEANAVLLEPNLVNECHERGLVLMSYGAINNEIESVKKQRKYGVDSIITDRVVGVGKRVLEEEETA
ncbi:GP-PDE domain-containing protein [Entamoeba marina]